MRAGRVAATLRRRVWLLVVTALTGAAVAFFATPHPRAYAARATLFTGRYGLAFNNRTHRQASLSIQASQLEGYTFAALVSGQQTARFAVEASGVLRSPDAVAAASSASVVPGTDLMRVTVVDRDPVVAARLANVTADAFNAELRALEPASAPGRLPTVRLFTAASVPTSRVATPMAANTLTGLVFGLVVAAAVALAEEAIAGGGDRRAAAFRRSARRQIASRPAKPGFAARPGRGRPADRQPRRRPRSPS